MAKAPKFTGNKSQEVRDYLDKHGKETPSKTVVAALAERGIEVSEGLVNNVKYKKSEKKAPKNGLVLGPNAVSVADVISMKELATRIGGIGNAQAALDALKKLSE